MSRPRNSAPLLAAAVVGMVLTFGVGWFLAGGGGGGTDPTTRLSSGRNSAVPTAGPQTPTPSSGFTPPSALPGQPLMAGVGGLPSTARVSKVPISSFDCPRATVKVSSADQLTRALAAARPGAVIALAAGVYQGEFVATRSGTAKRPIYLCGPRSAVLDAGGIKGGYTLHLNGASNWRVKGFTVKDGQKGVMLDGATGVGLEELLVEQIGDEAVHLRRGSSGNVVRGLTIRQTGLRRDKFGEGVYIGTAQSNWCEVNRCQPDHSDGNFVLGNAISATAAESVDIKEGTSGGVVAGNRFDGAGITAADSWVDVKGNGWLISGNRGSRAPEDGYQVHEITDGWGYRNLFSANVSDVNAGGYAIKVTKQHSGNVVGCDNRVRGAGAGLSNISCR